MIINELRIFCEVDGEQHIREVSYFKSSTLEERTQAMKNGFSVISVKQMNVCKKNVLKPKSTSNL